MALNVHFIPDKNIIQEAHIAFGGMAPTTILARQTCQKIIGKQVSSNDNALSFLYYVYIN